MADTASSDMDLVNDTSSDSFFRTIENGAATDDSVDMSVNSTVPPEVPSSVIYGLELDVSLQIGLYVLIFVLAVVGNVLVLVTLAQNRGMRTITNLFLLNLAIADLLVGVLCMPFSLTGTILKDFIFGHALCKLIPYLQGEHIEPVFKNFL